MFSKMFGTPNPTNAPQGNPPASEAKDQIKPNGMNAGDPPAAGVADPNNPDSGESDVNPLDTFKDLYNIEPPKDGMPNPPKLELNDDLFAKVIPSIDFTSGLSPEVKQKIASGDPSALLEAMQQVGATAYKTAMQHNTAVMNDHLDQRFEAYKPEISQRVDSKLTSQALSSLPNASNPVVRAELDRVSDQLRKKYPEAPNDWIATQTNTYLLELGKSLSATPESSKPPLPESVDFAELLSAEH